MIAAILTECGGITQHQIGQGVAGEVAESLDPATAGAGAGLGIVSDHDKGAQLDVVLSLDPGDGVGSTDGVIVPCGIPCASCKSSAHINAGSNGVWIVQETALFEVHSEFVKRLTIHHVPWSGAAHHVKARFVKKVVGSGPSVVHDKIVLLHTVDTPAPSR